MHLEHEAQPVRVVGSAPGQIYWLAVQLSLNRPMVVVTWHSTATTRMHDDHSLDKSDWRMQGVIADARTL